MKTIKEVELKLFIGSSVDYILHKANELGWSKSGEEFQEDTYYTSIYKDFISTEECLRIRETNTVCELTWKPPTTEAMLEERQFWKQEIDLNITGQKDIAKSLLKNLQYIEYVVVRKNRIRYDVDKQTNLSLDYIETLGWFLEIETFSDSEEQGVAKNREILYKLDFPYLKIINVPYRDLVKAGKVY